MHSNALFIASLLPTWTSAVSAGARHSDTISFHHLHRPATSCRWRPTAGSRSSHPVRPTAGSAPVETAAKGSGAADKCDSKLPSLDEVSDEEVLLACRAFLRRHRKVNWTQYERRKKARPQSLALTEGETGTVGYFWENPEELIYLKSKPTLSGTADGEASDLYAFSWEGEGGSFVEEGDNDSDAEGIESNYGEDTDETAPRKLVSDGLFTAFPSGPSEEHLRRSAAQQKKWSNPKWRKMWYGRRWGDDGEKKIPLEMKRQRKLEAMVESIPPALLNSSALAEISEEELSNAVLTYLQANKRRGDTLKKSAVVKRSSVAYWKETLKKGAGGKPVKGESQAEEQQTEEERLIELQRKRSEKSKKAYQTRLANERKRAEHKKKDEGQALDLKPVMPSSLPHVLKAQEALERLEWALFSGLSIDPSDIDVVLVPGRLSGRKDALLRILNERLHLRGKCIPDVIGVDGSESEKLLFATKCPVNKLGKFVKTKLQETKSKGNAQ